MLIRKQHFIGGNERLVERLARGELSDIEYQNKIRLLKLAKNHLKDKEEKEDVGIQVINKQDEQN